MKKVLKIKLNLDLCLSGASVLFSSSILFPATITCLFFTTLISTITGFGTSPVSAYSLNITTSGPLVSDIIPTAGGIGTNIVTDEINIVSNCRAGYTFSITGPADNNLYLNGDDSNDTAGTYFTPVDGTNALNNALNVNKWGYSLTASTGTGVFTPLSSTSTVLKTPSETASPSSDINTTMPIYYGT
ncbi:hypothetical protein IKG49_03710 [Candidatus Saccharibacteria bacterium]|nr:hypothetical protein [Candidatus Saccharibacteria bacterium]